ncbi:MAG TPA: cyclophilin-like fold protein [Caulobacteraceae bacterium]
MAILLASASVHGACSAEERSGGSASAPAVTAVTAPLNNTGPSPELDARTGPAMTSERIVISTDLGQVTAELDDNPAARALVRMLPVTIEMRDHLRQEKTGTLPSQLPEQQRQLEFSAGTVGLWGSDDFVIYYRDGRVPRPGIIILGRVKGDVAIFDRPGPVRVRVQLAD